ncbi:MAG: enoyl-CoA hydratase/isomerase [Hyphomicrobiales bacterium]|nr:enoyl-CoA hydratase/isomerase [Hyphomicrobiales bacterium]
MSFCRLEITDAVATLTLDRPDVMNALSPAMLEGLLAALEQVAAPDSGARCLIVTGAGKAFCAGANLQERISPRDGSVATSTALETHYHPVLRRLRDMPFPVITAVEGAAAGAGMSLALMGDLVICGRSAYFLQAFRRIGLVPDAGSSWMLPRLIGKARAMELSLLGEKLPAQKALDWGLVNRVVEDGAALAEARTLARDLAAGPTRALGMIRALYWESPENSFERQLDAECRTQRRALAGEDFREGVAAFLEKRPAHFSGR